MPDENPLNKIPEGNVDALKQAKLSDLVDPTSKANVTEKKAGEPAYTIPAGKPKIDEQGFEELPSIRTFQGDVGEAVKTGGLSRAQMAIKQGLKKPLIMTGEAEEVAQKQAVKKNLKLLIASLLLISAGLGTGAFFIVRSFLKNDIASGTPSEQRDIIRSESYAYLDISANTRRSLRASLAAELSRRPEAKEMDTIQKVIPVIKINSESFKQATLLELFNAAESSPPESLARAFYPQYFFGIWTETDKRELFLIAFTDSFDSAYSGLFSWESSMGADLSDMFDPLNTVTSTTTSFKDRVVYNNDTRSYEDADGNIVFFYTLRDGNMIIMARNESTLKKIVERVRESKLRY